MRSSSSSLNNVLAIFVLCLLIIPYVVVARGHHGKNHGHHHKALVVKPLLLLPEAPKENPQPAPEAPKENPQPAPEAPKENPQPAPEAPAVMPQRAPGAGSTPKAWLDAHNEERAKVGTPPLVWNQSLVDYAQNYANSRYELCEFKHSMGPFGENLASMYEDIEGDDAVRFWCTEKADYDHATNFCRVGEWQCGHYTQVVARKTISVGCAKAKCKNNWMFAICSYWPNGNIIGEVPF